MSRRNEIKKDLWKILQTVYQNSYFINITDKQNELLDQMVIYLSENYSLRRKNEKGKEADVAENDDAPLERPEAPPMRPYDYKEYRKLKGGSASNLPPPEPTPEPVKVKPIKPVKKTKKAESKPTIDLSALPPHLRKYVKS
jgi:hypothetical protein